MPMLIKNWKEFQHYSKRRPPWIKLYRTLLDDPEWHRLSGDAIKTLAGCWLVASERDGELPDIDTLAFRLRLDSRVLAQHISELKHWVAVSEGAVLAQCTQHATPETETETETETEAETEAEAKPAQKRLSYSEPFEDFWRNWPGKVKGPKGDAYEQWKKTSTLRPGCGTLLSMINAAELRRLSAQKRGEFQPEWPHVHRWLKKRRWEELEEQQPQQVKMCTLNGIGPMFPLRVPLAERARKIAELAEKGYNAS